MQRTVTSRVGAAAVAAVFVVTTGITAMEAHQLAAHTFAGEPAVALQPVALALDFGGDADQVHGHGHHAPTPEPNAADEHVGHAEASNPRGPSGHSDHGSTAECTCVGPCATGAPPTLSEGSFAEFSVGETALFREAPARARAVPQDPRSYLLPFSNGPPARV
jgi:hypothetical protein